VQVNAVSAVLAIDKDGLHAALSGGVMDLAHASPLPRVLNRVGEDDVRALDVKATVELVIEVYLRLASVLCTEYSLAEGAPVLWADEV